MKRHSLAVRQLSMLSAIHFVSDLLPGMMPGFLPWLLKQHSLSVGAGTLLLTLCAFSANGIQLWVGTLRKHAIRPLLLQVGLVLSCAVCLIGLVPPLPGAMWILALLVLTLGAGGACFHPEGLRSVCAVDATSIPPAISTSIFMLAGTLGSATGPLLSSLLLEHLGYPGFSLMLIPVVLLLIGIPLTRLRLASGHSHAVTRDHDLPHSTLGFWQILLIGTLINTGYAILQGLLPTYLSVFGFPLNFGGLSAMLFGIGAGIGTVCTGFLTRKFDTTKLVALELLIATPLLLLYFYLARNVMAIALILPVGALSGAGFPQLLVLARTAPGGPSLGTRMGILLGGSWGIAGALLWAVGGLANLIGLPLAMLLSPATLLLAPLLLLLLARKPTSNPTLQTDNTPIPD